MQLPHSILLLIFSAASLVQALPTRRVAPRDINISHKSLVNGTSTTHSIDAFLLPAELAEAIAGSDININLTTDRRKRSPYGASGVNNSTINLTVISSRSIALTRKQHADNHRSKRSKTPTPSHHNINIDASSNGSGGVGGIHNSTVNINLNSSKKERRKVSLGDHSVIVDVSASSSNAEGTATGIEDSTVHVNILPARALEKSTGHHSIVIDSSSTSSDDASSTKTGSHSAVVDTSSSSSNSSTGIKGSTINLTVISPSDSPSSSSEDSVESPIPSMARLSKRSKDAFADWSSKVQGISMTQYQSETDALAAAAEADAGLANTRRDHSSHKI
ncbi:hypothetical protein JCM16303_003758 [Sporobolomyces ruberrimus]